MGWNNLTQPLASQPGLTQGQAPIIGGYLMMEEYRESMVLQKR
jgi:hypothetical protein